jgi:hypothetical protein
MDLRTFRRNDPGRAECESQAAWRRLWADRRAHRPLDTRGPVTNGAASGPQFGHRGQTHRTLGGAEQLLATELVFEGHMKWAEGDGITVVRQVVALPRNRPHLRHSASLRTVGGSARSERLRSWSHNRRCHPAFLPRAARMPCMIPARSRAEHMYRRTICPSAAPTRKECIAVQECGSACGAALQRRKHDLVGALAATTGILRCFCTNSIDSQSKATIVDRYGAAARPDAAGATAHPHLG